MINNGDPVEASVVNAAFVSRTSNTTVQSIISLSNSISGPSVINLQGSINKIFDTIGTNESDSTNKNYGGAPILTNGSSYKQCLIDLANSTSNLALQIAAANSNLSSLQATVTSLQSTVNTLQTNVNNLTTDLNAVKNQAFTFNGNKTFQNDVTVNGIIQGNDANFTNVNMTGLLSTANKLTINNLLTQTQATLNGSLTVYAASSFENSVTIQGASASLSVQRPATFSDAVTISGASSSFSVGCDASFNEGINQTSGKVASFGVVSSKSNLLTLNESGSSTAQANAGFEVKGPTSYDDGYFKIDSTKEKWILKAPNKAGLIEFVLPSTGTISIPSSTSSGNAYYIPPEERTLGEAITAGTFVMRYGGDYSGESRKKLYKLPFSSKVNAASLVLVHVTTPKAADTVLSDTECCLFGTFTLTTSLFSASDFNLWLNTSNGTLVSTPPTTGPVIEVGWVLAVDKLNFNPVFVTY